MDSIEALVYRMTESIMKYVSKIDNLNIGVGVSKTGEVKLSPFTVQENDISISNVNNDEFGYYCINEDKDYENLKHFYFGIDLSGALLSINGSSSADLTFNKMLKSNEQILHTYRKIIKKEMTIAKKEELKLNEDAINMLKESTHKFHATYGNYFISSYSKGGALSVFGHMSKSENQISNNLSQKFSVGGDFSKVVKFNVNDEISLKKSSFKNFQFTECKSSSVGLVDETKTIDFQLMIDKLENLENFIGDGSVIIYEVSKYDLCSEYIKIINAKNKWKLFLEDFNSLSLEIQRDNIKLYQIIKKYSKIAALSDLKEQEVNTELRLRELIKQNNVTNVEKCSEYIISNNIRLAVETLEVNKNAENIFLGIKTALNESFSNFTKALDFASCLKSDSEKALALISIYTCMKLKKLTNGIEMTQLAYNIHKHETNMKEPSLFSSELFEYLRKHCIPDCLQRIFWMKRVSIISFKHHRYLHAAENSEHVYMTNGDKNNKTSVWIFNTNNDGQTFTIENEAIGFLKLNDLKTERILIVNNIIDECAHWSLELAESGFRLKNCKFSEYLCTDKDLLHEKIFTSKANNDLKSLFIIDDSTLDPNNVFENKDEYQKTSENERIVV